MRGGRKLYKKFFATLMATILMLPSGLTSAFADDTGPMSRFSTH